MATGSPHPSQSPPKGGAAGRQPEIDTLRGLAVLFVVFDHFGISRFWDGFPWGIVGVKLLFLFSGYFLTRDLLHSRGLNFGALLGIQTRRLLRIVPVGAAILLVGFLLGVEGSEAGLRLDWLFFANLRVMVTGEWVGAFSHLWSLALQMQFYLLWPLVCFLLPQRFWVGAISACFVFAWGYRAICLATGAPDLVRWMHLSASIDAFGAGALMAWLDIRRSEWAGICRHNRWVVLTIGAACLAAGYHMRLGGFPAPVQALMESAECLFAFSLFALVRWRAMPMLALFRMPPLPWIGAVSFGLYGFHPIVESFLRRSAPGLAALASWSFELLLLLVSLVAAWGCLVLIERPVARLTKDICPTHLSQWLHQSIAPVPRVVCTALIAVFLVFPLGNQQGPQHVDESAVVVDSGEAPGVEGGELPMEREILDHDALEAPWNPDLEEDWSEDAEAHA